MPFQDAILAGNTLVRDSIKSENYVAGTTGWQITRDGNAEFNKLNSRGSFISGNGTGSHIEILSTTANFINFFTGDAAETNPGGIGSNIVSPGTKAQVGINSPSLGKTNATFVLESTNVTGGDSAYIRASHTYTQTPIAIENETWNPIQFVNGWIPVGTSTPRYRKDAAANVHFQGRISSGTAGQITTIADPLYLPTQALDFPLKSNNDAGSISWLQVNPVNGNISIVGNVAFAQTWLALDFMYSTL